MTKTKCRSIWGRVVLTIVALVISFAIGFGIGKLIALL